jgi:hypothetical protein
MGTFNILNVNLPCPFCGYKQLWRIQYKYGYCRQYEKHIGDYIEWVSPRYDYGRNTGGYIKTEGIVEDKCQKCLKEDIEGAVYIRNNVITEVELLQTPLSLGEEGFEVLH